jgi:hypothetical protein
VDVEGRRREVGGTGAGQLAMGDKIRGVFYKAQPHRQCDIYTDGFKCGGVWELRTRTRRLTEEEEEERIAKASTAGAKSVVNFLQGGHQFEMKADIQSACTSHLNICVLLLHMAPTPLGTGVRAPWRPAPRGQRLV